MYQRILVAVDRSEMCKQVIQEAIALAKTTGALLNLVHVLSYEDDNAPGLTGVNNPAYQQRWASFEQEGTRMLQAALAEATDAGVSADYTLVPGKPGRVICEIAANWDADLILLGRRRMAGVQEFLLGSVSNHVVHAAPCSVFVVQGSATPAMSAA